MNEMNKFLLTGDKQPRVRYRPSGTFTKIKKGYRNLNKQAINNIFDMFIKTNVVLNMIWLMEILKI